MSTLAEEMAAYATALRFEDLPPAVVHEVKRRMIDALGCALGAWHAGPCAAARTVASKFSAERGATLLGTRQCAPPDWAAFANGCLVRYLDFNDTYLSKEPAHPSDNIPAALAVTETIGANGRDLIVAVALAYEVQCRLCDAARLRGRGWDHVSYGAFSTALIAARLMGLDTAWTRHALGIAGVAGAALRQSRVGELSHWKGCAFANAARHGVFAAMLARAGVTGPAPIFEGENGFEKLVSGKLETRVSDWADGRNGSEFMILKTSIKFWPAEYHAQSAIEAALKLRAELNSELRKSGSTSSGPPAIQIEDIESVLVQSHDAAVDIIGAGPEKWRPASRETADHSLPYLVAAALADGEITPRQFTDSRLADLKLLDLVQRVQVERHAELSRLYPGAVGNIVTVTLRNGLRRTERVDFPRGHARNPLTDAEVEAKFHALSEPLLGPKCAGAVLRWLWSLERAGSLEELFRLAEVQA
jgi:2-methylcitrate dehydratase